MKKSRGFFQFQKHPKYLDEINAGQTIEVLERYKSCLAFPRRA
jgi:hypothetical protein